MKSALKSLFESEAADRVIRFLRTRGEKAHIVAPAWVRDRVTTNIPDNDRAPRASWSDDLVTPATSAGHTWNFIVIAEDAALERNALAALSLHKGMKAYGLFSDVLPALLCGAKGLGRGHSIRELKRYAVMSIPRSGSRYLSATLTTTGLGVPQEHLREPLAKVITEGKLGFGPAVEGLERFGQRNGIFGTKLISTFLLQACKGRLPELESNVAWMIDRGYLFVHLDRPLNDAVVSSYIAFRLNKWHFFGQMDASSKNKLNDLTFNERAIWEEYIRFRAQKAIMDHIADRFQVQSFPYQTIQDDVKSIVGFICEHINVNPHELDAGSALIPVATRTESHTYEVFASALNKLLDRRQHEILRRTVQVLQHITGASQETAERLAIAKTFAR